jgi:hypothetical protein
VVRVQVPPLVPLVVSVRVVLLLVQVVVQVKMLIRHQMWVVEEEEQLVKMELVWMVSPQVLVRMVMAVVGIMVRVVLVELLLDKMVRQMT